MKSPTDYQTYFFMPPLAKISGGMAVLAQLASHLAAANFKISFVTSGLLPDGLKTTNIPVLQLKNITCNRNDRWLIPEGWPNALLPALKAGSQCAIYVQNWAFLLGRLPEGLAWKSLPVKMLAVSNPVKKFIYETTGLSAMIVPPAIDSSIFYCDQKQPQTPSKKIRIAWMPRKNKGIARQIRTIFEAIAKTRGENLPEWVAMEDLPLHGVANVLRSCQMFLSTGFPEGFGLPPLEAMACGCLVAGFTGMGGWDYMRQALPHGYRPDFDLPDVPWAPNGFFAADGDIWGATKALLTAYDMLLQAADLTPIKHAACATASWYSPVRQKQAILSIWQDATFWKNDNESSQG